MKHFEETYFYKIHMVKQSFDILTEEIIRFINNINEVINELENEEMNRLGFKIVSE